MRSAGERPGRTRNLELSWQPSPDPDVVSYRIYLGPSAQSYDTIVPVESFGLEAGVAVAELSGVDAGARFIALSALDAGGNESVLSNELQIVATCDPAACADSNPCSVDGCGSDGCTHTLAADGITCNDGDATTSGDVCRAGTCSGTPVCPPTGCSDDNVCTVDTCTSTGCAHAPAANGTTCNDGDGMTTGDVCRAGSCSGTPVCPLTGCSDDNACTVDACTSSGCTHTPAAEGTTCNDGDATTSGDVCRVGGTCSGTPVCQPTGCSDGNACTVDTCTSTGCTHAPAADGATCDDGNAGTAGDACRAGSCAGVVIDGDGRTVMLRWQPSPDDDVVSYNIYLGTRSGSYDTVVPVESFALESGVAVALLTGLGDDAYFVAMSALDAADQESVYSNELAIGAVCNAANCADTNPCTVDRCGAAGCSHAAAADGTLCSDGDAGTLNDRCSAGTCTGELPAPPPACSATGCNDGNACTLDACGPTGCVHSQAPDGTTCNDGDTATLGDTCRAGRCAGELPLPPGRQVEIRWEPSPDTDVVRYVIHLGPSAGSYDTHVPVESFALESDVAVAVLAGLDGATHHVALTAIDAAGNESLTSNDLVIDAACSAASCADTNPCTVDACSAAGCAHSAAPDGTTCSDGQAGTVNDRCQAGSCVGLAAQPSTPASDDFDANGFSDLLALDPAARELTALLRAGDGSTTARVLGSALPEGDWELVARDDFDGDGSADVLLREQTLGLNTVWLLDGSTITASLALPSQPDLGWQIIHTGDLDGDGRADLIWYHAAQRLVASWRLDGANVLESRFLGSSPSAEWVPVGSGDLEGDGMLDLVWRHTASGANAAWLMSNARVTASVFLPSLPAGFALEASGDFDRDGRTDLVWRDAASGQSRLWRMDGSLVREVVDLPLRSGAGVRAIGSGDYDGDGASDLLWHDSASGELWLWTLDPESTVKAPENEC